MTILPVYEILDQVSSALLIHPTVILHAPPGAGKTTVVPLELLKAPFLGTQKILMLEPRRLAATNAARYMASLRGEDVGQTLGYTIRFESRTSSSTRIEVVTEGILTRRLQQDPFLKDVGIVIFDEFHERNLNSDIALALCRDIQLSIRTDLKILIMSATLDCAPLSRILGDAPVVSSQGRNYPVEIRYRDPKPHARISEAAAEAVMCALREAEGDILVFLPGAGEIRECEQRLRPLHGEGLSIFPLYGDLPFSDQEKAVRPAEHRKVVLATNIAETSLTIEGVSVVVDTGWSRQIRFDQVRGIDRLQTARISAASADQRCGRAGRLGPGVCYRLWNEHVQSALIPYTLPEIQTADMAPLALELALWGVADPESLSWLDPPPSAGLAAAKDLLVRLGALDGNGLITATGKEMAKLPLHPRLARLLLEGVKRNIPFLAADIAALLSERDIYRSLQCRKVESTASDLSDRIESLMQWRLRGEFTEWLDPHACRSVDRSSRHILRSLGLRSTASDFSDESVASLLACAFPDRIGQQREPGSDRYLLSNGRGGRLSPRSAIRPEMYIVAPAVEGREGGDSLIHLASAISLDMLRREFAPRITRQRVVFWDSQQGKVCAREEERLQALVLESIPVPPSGEEISRALLDGVRTGGIAAFRWSHKALQIRNRVGLLHRNLPQEGWPDLSHEHLDATLEEWLLPWLSEVRTSADLSRIDLEQPLRAIMTREQLRALEIEAPTHVQVPSGSRIALEYQAEGPPVLAVKLQELFGLAETPRIARGRVAVLLHLLSPARRPLQVTQDLNNFWNSTYEEVKKELKGRYPKHPWPDNPWEAVPTRFTKKKFENR